MQNDNQAADKAADASAAAVTSEQPAKAPKKAAPAKLKPCTTQEYKDPETGAIVTIAHDPNKGLYVETRIIGYSTTVTTHQTAPHEWARLVKISK